MDFPAEPFSPSQKNKVYTADLHSHAWVTQERGRFEFDSTKRTLKTLVDRCIDANLDITAFTNFSDDRYTALRETAYALPKNYSMTDLSERGESVAMLVFRDNRKDPVVVLRSQEVPSKEGHILTLGAPRNLKEGRTLQDTINEAREYGAIIIADHPYTPRARGGMGEENLKKFLGQYDALEGSNAQNISPFSFMNLGDLDNANLNAQKFASKNNVPSIAVSDSHTLKDVGLAYISFAKAPDMKDGRKFIESMKEIIVKEDFHARGDYTDRSRLLGWHIRLAYDLARRKVGLLK